MIVKTKYSDYLMHYGRSIKDGAPGVGTGNWRRDGSEYSSWYGNDPNLAIKRLKKAKLSNYDKWGKTKDSNILYVRGLSGSGKSTVSGYLADKNGAEVINLDSYLSPMSEESKKEIQNKNFNSFLDKKVPNWNKVVDENGNLDGGIIDKIAKASEEYGKKRFKDNKVIIEGVQLMDDTFYESQDFYKDKPVVNLTTSFLASTYRGSIRDSDNIADMLDLMTYRIRYANSKRKWED